MGRFFATAVFTAPEFTWAAQLELVIPLVLTVVVVQNGQGAAVLRSAGHCPPMNIFAVNSGIFSLLNASLGAVSACVTGPTNALLTASGQKQRQSFWRWGASPCCGPCSKPSSPPSPRPSPWEPW